jgi:hypothetical protein
MRQPFLSGTIHAFVASEMLGILIDQCEINWVKRFYILIPFASTDAANMLDVGVGWFSIICPYLTSDRSCGRFAHLKMRPHYSDVRRIESLWLDRGLAGTGKAWAYSHG